MERRPSAPHLFAVPNGERRNSADVPIQPSESPCHAEERRLLGRHARQPAREHRGPCRNARIHEGAGAARGRSKCKSGRLRQRRARLLHGTLRPSQAARGVDQHGARTDGHASRARLHGAPRPAQGDLHRLDSRPCKRDRQRTRARCRLALRQPREGDPLAVRGRCRAAARWPACRAFSAAGARWKS